MLFYAAYTLYFKKCFLLDNDLHMHFDSLRNGTVLSD